MLYKVFLFIILGITTNHAFSVKPKKRSQENAQSQEEDKEVTKDNSLDGNKSQQIKENFFHFPVASPVLNHATKLNFQNGQSNDLISIHPHAPLSIIDERINKAQKSKDVTEIEKIVYGDERILHNFNTNLDNLPFDITSNIFNYLMNPDKYSLAMTCKRLNANFNQINIVELENKRISSYILSLLKMKSKFLNELLLSDMSEFSDLCIDTIRSELKDVKFNRLKSIKLSGCLLGKNLSFFLLEIIRILSEENLNTLKSFELTFVEQNSLIPAENNSIKDSLVQFTKSKSLSNISCFIMSGTRLDEGFAEALVEAMSNGHFLNLTYFDISNNKLKAKDIKSILNTLYTSKVNHLKYLNLSRNQITNESIKALTDGVVSGKLTDLTHLLLDSTELKFEGIYAITEAAESNNLSKLIHLSIAQNQIGNEGIVLISKVLARGYFPNLTHLNIASNKVEISGADELFKSLFTSNHSKITYLNIGMNKIGDIGLTTLIKFMCSEHPSNLTHLDISLNGISDEGIKNLFEAIQASRLPKLSHLNISRNRIRTSFDDLAKAIKSHELSELTSLDISSNFFPGDLYELAKYIDSGYLPKLKTLIIDDSMSENEIKRWVKRVKK